MFKRRKILSLLMSFVMIIAVSAGLEISSFAEDDILSYLTYEINDGAVTIIDCEETISGDITIPDIIENTTVTGIGAGAFDNCNDLRSVSIPESVWTIGEDAFFGCYNIRQFVVDDSNPFVWADSYGVLINKLSKTLLQYPAANENPSYTIPTGIQFIGNNAFYGAYNLSEITISDGVSNIGEYSIAFCDSLESVTVPVSVTSIGYGVFFGCDNLTVYSNNNSTAHNYADENSINFVAIDDIEDTEKSVLKLNVGSSWVGESVYITLSGINMAGLESADLEFSFDEEYFEFDDIGIPYESAEILDVIWSGGQNDAGNVSCSFCFVAEATADTDLVVISLIALKPGISEVSVTCRSWDGGPGKPDDASVKIGLVKRPVIEEEGSTDFDEDFSEPDYEENGYGYFTYVVIDDEVKITDCDHSATGEIVVPETIEGYPVTTIGESAFAGCYHITNVVLPDGITEIGSKAFSSCGLESVNIPESVTALREFTFSGCYKLTEVIVPDNITDVEMGVFSNCMGLEKVILSDSLTKISDAMFNACFNLKDVTIPDTVTEIGEIAFYQCYSLESIVLPESVEKLGAMAFGDIPNLKDIYIYNPDIDLVFEYDGIDYDGIYNVTSVPEGFTLEEYVDLYLEYVSMAVKLYGAFDADDYEEYREQYRELIEKLEDIGAREHYSVKTDLTIHGYDESTAHDFADKNGINFVAFESEEVNPDDSQQDNTEDNTCSRCGEVHSNVIEELFCTIKSFFTKIIDFLKSLFVQV